MSTVYTMMEKLIEAKMYTDLATVDQILNAFLAVEEITPLEFTELRLLAKNLYDPVIEEPIQEIL